MSSLWAVEMHKRQPAVFLDRDGTLIEDVGVLGNPEDIRLLAGIGEALRKLQEKYALFIITNQPNIAKGLLTVEQVSAVNERLVRILASEGVHIRQWYVCPHARQDGCQCIKPNPTFILQAVESYDIDLRRSFVIGDHPHDVLTGETVGVLGLYVLTGHGLRHLEELPLDKLIFHTLEDATAWILAHPTGESALYESIQSGAEAIRRGGLVAFPTETVYGLGADALNPKAVARIYEVKQRPLDDPLIVHIAEREQVQDLVAELSPKAKALMEAFWPGPLTLVLPKAASVPDIVTAGNPSVAVRMPANPWARELIRLARTPVAAPSANRFGCTSPTTARHVQEQLHGHYDVLIDGGACRIGIESTVLSLIGDRPILLRPGGLAQQAMEALTGPVQDGYEGKVGGKKPSPGLMPRHYAPSTPLVISEDIRPYADHSDVGLILFRDSGLVFRGPVEYLSRDGDLREAATNLYRAMRALDRKGLQLIVAQYVPSIGLGVAINDRLKKAASQHTINVEQL